MKATIIAIAMTFAAAGFVSTEANARPRSHQKSHARSHKSSMPAKPFLEAKAKPCFKAKARRAKWAFKPAKRYTIPTHHSAKWHQGYKKSVKRICKPVKRWTPRGRVIVMKCVYVTKVTKRARFYR